jgi:hypothetical protein
MGYEITAILADHIKNIYNNKGKQGAQEDSSTNSMLNRMLFRAFAIAASLRYASM